MHEEGEKFDEFPEMSLSTRGEKINFILLNVKSKLPVSDTFLEFPFTFAAVPKIEL